MFPLGNFEHFIDDNRKYTKFQQHNVSPDHQIVLIPVSPSRSSFSSNLVQSLAKSRLVWLIAILILIFIMLSYQAYQSHTKQLRLLTYLDRVDELKDFMGQVKHQIQAATVKLQELRRIQQLHDNSTSFVTAL